MILTHASFSVPTPCSRFSRLPRTAQLPRTATTHSCLPRTAASHIDLSRTALSHDCLTRLHRSFFEELIKTIQTEGKDRPSKEKGGKEGGKEEGKEGGQLLSIKLGVRKLLDLAAHGAEEEAAMQVELNKLRKHARTTQKAIAAEEAAERREAQRRDEEAQLAAAAKEAEEEAAAKAAEEAVAAKAAKKAQKEKDFAQKVEARRLQQAEEDARIRGVGVPATSTTSTTAAGLEA